MDFQRQLTYALRFDKTSPKKEGLINALAQRFYVDQQAELVSRHNTAVMCFPSDTLEENRDFLIKKIKVATAYATTTSDIQARNALLHLPPFSSHREANKNLMLGLYLYFADECSHLGTDKTFLTAMREAGAELEVNPKGIVTNHIRAELFTKTMNALESLKADELHGGISMAESHGDILKEWFESGSYTIEGHRHGVDKTGQLEGAYAKLAHEIALDQQYMGINPAVSYALVNKCNAQTMNAAERYQHAETMAENRDRIIKYIEQGDKNREDFLADKVLAAVIPQKVTDNKTHEAQRIISYLSPVAQEILYREGYTCAYGHNSNISTVYPKQDLPEFEAAACEAARKSNGSRLNQYRVIFLSDGAEKCANPQDPEMKAKSVAQTLGHETMHMIISYLDDDQRAVLKKAVEAVHEELKTYKKRKLPDHFYELLNTLNTNTFAETVDYNDCLYPNYVEKNKDGSVAMKPDGKPVRDTRWEEVACNVFSLLSTEYAGSKDSPFSDSAASLPSMKNLAKEINAAAQYALEECRLEHRGPLPGKRIVYCLYP